MLILLFFLPLTDKMFSRIIRQNYFKLFELKTRDVSRKYHLKITKK
jgi:hypothetical protein